MTRVTRGLKARIRSSVVTIGMFDGVHKGHQKILRTVAQDARRLRAQSLVITFERHPQTVMGQRERLGMITTNPQKLRLFEKLGIQRALLVPFNKSFAKISPESFVEDILLKKLGMRELCVGYDFAFGRDRKGNIALLRVLARRHAFRLKVFGPYRYSGTVVSSTVIRGLLSAGILDKAAKFLGRSYAMEGLVEKGLGLGKTLGFATANVHMANDSLLPEGVYAVRARGKGFLRPGVLNVGYRPTIMSLGRRAGKTWELHVWDFHKDLYGKYLEISFAKRLRPEKKFPSLAALSAQIGRDVEVAKKVME